MTVILYDHSYDRQLITIMDISNDHMRKIEVLGGRG